MANSIERAIRTSIGLPPTGQLTPAQIAKMKAVMLFGMAGGSGPMIGAKPRIAGQNPRGNFTKPTTYRGPNVLTADGIKPTYKISEGKYINSGGEYAPTPPSMAGVLVDGAGKPVPTVANKSGGGSQNPLAQAAAAGMGDPAPTLQQQKLDLAQKKFALEETKFNAAATASQAAQEAQKNANKNVAPKQPVTVAPKQPPKRGGGGGGGGGGGRGGRGEKSPETKAREKGRMDRAMDRENRRTSATADRRDAEEYAKSRGFNNVRAMQDHDANQAFFDRNRKGDKGNTPGQPFDRNKPVKDPYTGEMMSVDDYEKLAKERIKNDKSLKPSEENGGGGGRKMVQAYGNKNSKVWVKARGDFG
jgi:hypothetical protein